ncbi:hypothetical protein [Vibrio crassostreae]|uniref:hypothetical protein n=1 Tax=Vibrio crassostreae TaxID=246167 RepID=UPI001B312F99|nr:hypothetical protein [Vibrio crassostreae]
MTTRRVLVIRAVDKGPSSHCFCNDDGSLLIDTSPDREEIHLEGINCTPSEFCDWFLTVEESHGRYSLLFGGQNSLIDIEGSCHDLSVGKVLEVNFDEYFSAFIEMRIQAAKRELDWYVDMQRNRLGLFVE